MKIFKRIKWSYVVLSAMFLLLGIYLVVNPETSLIMICRILGAALAVFGVMKIVLYFIREVEGVAIRFDFAVGLFCIILGALIGLILERTGAAMARAGADGHSLGRDRSARARRQRVQAAGRRRFAAHGRALVVGHARVHGRVPGAGHPAGVQPL